MTNSSTLNIIMMRNITINVITTRNNENIFKTIVTFIVWERLGVVVVTRLYYTALSDRCNPRARESRSSRSPIMYFDCKNNRIRLKGRNFFSKPEIKFLFYELVFFFGKRWAHTIYDKILFAQNVRQSIKYYV